jgi:hypothetical protein
LNWLRESPLLKYVDDVPSGPTKLNGPLISLLPATWSLTLVLAEVAAFHEIVPQIVVLGSIGFESLAPDTKLPDEL